MHVNTLKFYKYAPVKKPMYKGKFCGMPYDTLSIDEDGDVQLCDCSLHMPYTVGNIYKQSLKEIWSGAQAHMVRQAVADGDFTYCNWACSKLKGLIPIDGEFTPLTNHFPSVIKIDMDRSCNLKCPSCREQVIIEKHSAKINKQIEIFKEIQSWAQSNPATTITVVPVGSGEVFASHSALEFLKSLADYPLDNLKIHVTTNGTLIKKNQDLIFKIKHLITDWSISIDAATSKTYAQVRGGNWDDLIAGLDIIREMGVDPLFKFCIQKNNYHEIEAFADLVAQYHGRIDYQKLRDWGHWTTQWWNDNNVFDRTGEEFDQVMNSLNTITKKYGKKIGVPIEFTKHLKNTLP